MLADGVEHAVPKLETRLPKDERGESHESPARQADSAGDPIPPNCQLIEVHVAELNQLFKSVWPSAFATRT